MKISLTFFTLLMLSCSSSNHVIEIKEIEKDTIICIQDHSTNRTNIFLNVTGEVDDTAFIQGGIAIPPGKVNISGNYDYYSLDSICISYSAHRATKGYLKIQVK